MNYSEVKRNLKREFELFLKPLGYKSVNDPQGCEFINPNQIGSCKIGYGVANYGDEFNTGVYISVHIKKMGKLICDLFDEIYIENAGGVISSGTSTYFNDINYRYKIKNEEDVKAWGEIVRMFYTEYAVPFFEKYNSIDTIDKLLNENPNEKVIYCDDLGWRIISGLCAARLNENPKYNELRDYYKGEVEGKFKGHFMYEKCIKAISYLDGHTLEELNIIANS